MYRTDQDGGSPRGRKVVLTRAGTTQTLALLRSAHLRGCTQRLPGHRPLPRLGDTPHQLARLCHRSGQLDARRYGAQVGYTPARSTNGMAIASFICAWVWVFGVTSVLAVIFGFVSLGQIRRANGGQNGKVLTIFGIVLGILGIASDVAWIVSVSTLASHVNHCIQYNDCPAPN